LTRRGALLHCGDSMKLRCAIAVVWMVSGLPFISRAELVDGIKAIVSESIITYQQILDRTAPLEEELRRQYRNEPDVYARKLRATQDESLDQLMDDQLILHEFDSSGQYNLPESIIDEQLQATIRSMYGEDRVRFIKTLQAEGKTYEQFRKDYRDRLIISQMRYMHGSSEVIVSPHAIEVYYVNHKDQFKVESEVKLRMIILNKKPDDTNETAELAGEILSKIKAGASFTEMATMYSEGSQHNGGDWGWVEKSVLLKELADVAFTLKPGQVSGVIDTPKACFIMLVEDRRAEHIKPLNDVRDDIEKTLLAQERDRLQKQWIERLRKKTFVLMFP
jgi:parvulin-like peptidyl-prolyl isomerase